MTQEIMFISRNALSSGCVRKVSAVVTKINGHEYAQVGMFNLMRVGHDIHRTEEAAIENATHRRDRKIQSLEGQIRKLQQLNFKVK